MIRVYASKLRDPIRPTDIDSTCKQGMTAAVLT
jgi:hypothetical protein